MLNGLIETARNLTPDIQLRRNVDNNLSNLEPILKPFREGLSEIYERLGDDKEQTQLVDTCVIEWIDSIFDSLDTISDYPPPAEYYPALFKPTLDIMQGFLRHMRKLCILRYRVVPKLLAEDDFWIWACFGIEQNRFSLLMNNPERVAQEIKSIMEQRHAAQITACQRIQVAELRVRESMPNNESSTILKFAAAPEFTQAFISKGVSKIVDAVIKKRLSVSENVEPPDTIAENSVKSGDDDSDEPPNNNDDIIWIA